MPNFRISDINDLDDSRYVEAKDDIEAYKLYLEGEGELWSEKEIKDLKDYLFKPKETKTERLKHFFSEKLDE